MTPTTLEHARAILGDEVLDLDVVQQFFQICVSDSWRAELRDMPFEPEILARHKSTHVLFAGVPLSIRDLRQRVPQCFDRFFPCAHRWFVNDETVDLRWYLLREDVVPGSKGKSFKKQLSCLSKCETVPRACEAVYGIMLYFLVRGIRLFADAAARCADIEPGFISPTKVHVDVGNFDEKGLLISLMDDGPDEDIGLVSVVMPMNKG